MYHTAVKLIAAAALGLAGAQVANAADLPAKAFSPARVAPAYSWTGCYFGVHVGGGWQESSFAGGGGIASGVGAVGGGQVGCNYQIRQFVIGVEGELWGSSLYDRDASSSFLIGLGAFSNESKSRNIWDAAVSVRSGVAFDRAFVYGKLGVVWGDFDYTANAANPFIGTSTTTASATMTGVLIGVGFEYALTDNWTTKFEYNYIDYGNAVVNFTQVNCNPACATQPFSNTVKEVKQLAKLGLNYKF